jgi:acyl-CoA synthetase (AMP-forming)/AMP-acid ligase II
MVSSWGATETSPVATAGHLLSERAGVIGLPAPGVTLKFVPSGGQLEVRVRGPTVFSGYWGRPDLLDAFDGRLHKSATPRGSRPAKGVFDGGWRKTQLDRDPGARGRLASPRSTAAAPAAGRRRHRPRRHVGLLAYHLAHRRRPSILGRNGDDRGSRHAQSIAAHNAAQRAPPCRSLCPDAGAASIDASEITDRAISTSACWSAAGALVERLMPLRPRM